MRKFAAVLLLMAFGGVSAGWLSVSGPNRASQENDANWNSPAPPQFGEQERKSTYEALLASGHFGSAKEPTAPETGDEADAPPRVLATAIKDGAIAVSVYGQEGAIVTAGVGETLPGGWIIIDADLNRVTIARDDQTLDLKVFPYGDAES